MISTSLDEVKTLKRDGNFTEAIQKIDVVLSELEATQRSKRIELLKERSSLLRFSGNYEEAEKTAYKALHLAQQPPIISEGQGWALLELGIVYVCIVYNREEINNVSPGKT